MKRRYLILFSLSGFVLCLDQLTKHWIRLHVPEGTRRVLLDHFVTVTHSRNTGFAFGLLERAPESLRDVFFIGIPVFALVLIVMIFIKLQDDEMLSSVALTSILGGAVGNLIDRLQYGFVIDFLEIGLPGHFVLPAFNVADCSIIVGLVLMFINTLTNKHRPAESAA